MEIRLNRAYQFLNAINMYYKTAKERLKPSDTHHKTSFELYDVGSNVFREIPL